MPLVRTRVDENELAEDTDFNRTNESAFANLKLALLHSLLGPAGTSGVLRGLALSPNSPTGMSVIVGPGAAFDPTGELVILESPTLLNVSPAHATLPRIDLVSIGATDGEATPEERLFIDDSDDPPTTFPDTINTQRRISISATLTPGAPNAAPVAPAAPAGQLAIWQVRVDAAVTTIEASKLSRVGTPPIVGPDRIRAVTFPGHAATQNLPWTSDSVDGSILAPPASLTVILASIYMQSGAGGAAEHGYDFRIEDVDSGEIIGQHRQTPTVPTTYISNVQFEGSVFFFGVKAGSTQERRYRLRVSNARASEAATVRFPLTYPTGTGGTVVNRLVAFSL